MGATVTTLELGDGTTEEVGFFGDLFGVTHLPPDPPLARVLVCSPLYSEFLKNNRREVLLGRKLAMLGMAVQRFHYRGTGNSTGAASNLTIDSMVEDAALAAAHLSEVAGPGPIDVVTTRLASLAATTVTAPDSRMVMWEPVNDGKRYSRELTRAVLILGVRQGTGRSAADLEEEFSASGSLDIAGFSVARGLRDSAVSRTLQIPRGSGPVLVAQLGRTSEIRKDIAGVIGATEESGRPVSSRAVELEEAWWFHQDVNLLKPDEGAALDSTLVELTADWLVRTGA